MEGRRGDDDGGANDDEVERVPALSRHFNHVGVAFTILTLSRWRSVAYGPVSLHSVQSQYHTILELTTRDLKAAGSRDNVVCIDKRQTRMQEIVIPECMSLSYTPAHHRPRRR